MVTVPLALGVCGMDILNRDGQRIAEVLPQGAYVSLTPRQMDTLEDAQTLQHGVESVLTQSGARRWTGTSPRLTTCSLSKGPNHSPWP